MLLPFPSIYFSLRYCGLLHSGSPSSNLLVIAKMFYHQHVFPMRTKILLRMVYISSVTAKIGERTWVEKEKKAENVNFSCFFIFLSVYNSCKQTTFAFTLHLSYEPSRHRYSRSLFPSKTSTKGFLIPRVVPKEEERGSHD